MTHLASYQKECRMRTGRTAARAIATMVMVLGIVGPAFATGSAEAPEATPVQSDPARLVLATTTSTENSGLLAELLPPFEEEFNVTVNVIAVGTGQALQIGRSGDADVLMVHAPALEEEFVADGFGVERVYFMYNDFVVLGPPGDPAGVRNASTAADAFGRIADAGATFISRGDNSGTHVKERDVWASAGVDPTDASGGWYREVGQGMGAVITLANDQEAYTLSDRGTYLSYVSDIDLEVVNEGDESLFNPYGAIAVNPERHPHVQAQLAQALIDYIVSAEGQQRIADYTVNGFQLFFPDAQ
jgi:tungstate transport system substrate-binding protein